MQVVRVGHMRVHMLQRRMLVGMTVRPRWHDLMGMQVVAIVMRMGMLMLQSLMVMRVAV